MRKQLTLYVVAGVLAAVVASAVVTTLLSGETSAQSGPVPENRTVPVPSLAEAERLVGYLPVSATFIPDGYVPNQTFVQLDKKAVLQSWSNPAIPGSLIQLVQDPTVKGLLVGEPVPIRGGEGERADHPMLEGRPFGITDVYWRNEPLGVMVSVSRIEGMTDDVLNQIVEGVR